MGLKIENGKVTVSAGYGITQNLGNFSSQKANSQVSIEFDFEGEEASAIAESQRLYDTLQEAVKLGVMAHLSIEGAVDADGVLQPQLGPTPAAAPAPAAQAAPVASAAPYVAGARQFPAAKDVSDCPIFSADIDGSGVKNWIDLRPAKADGRYKPNAADFRNAAQGQGQDQVWLKERDGSIKQSVVNALTAAGQPV